MNGVMKLIIDIKHIILDEFCDNIYIFVLKKFPSIFVETGYSKHGKSVIVVRIMKIVHLIIAAILETIHLHLAP